MSQSVSHKPSGRGQMCESCVLASVSMCDCMCSLFMSLCVCVCVLDVTDWLPLLCLHGNLHNKQLYLDCDFRDEERMRREDMKEKWRKVCGSEVTLTASQGVNRNKDQEDSPCSV